MSIFGKIVSAIFGGSAQAAPATGAPGSAGALPAGATPLSNVDVTAVMDKLSDASDEDLDWKTSIVDLMKLLKMDSSITARKELASELAYTGSTSDSAAMNVWLHKQVMTKLAENGGKLPAGLGH
jgi:hypothetical protein